MGKKLYVGNLPFSATEQELCDIFGQVGTVQSIRIVMDRDTGRSKGFSFVEMATDDEAREAIARFNGSLMGGRPMTLNEARPMETRRDPRQGQGYGGVRSYRNSAAAALPGSGHGFGRPGPRY